jgi:hypothetical protein
VIHRKARLQRITTIQDNTSVRDFASGLIGYDTGIIYWMTPYRSYKKRHKSNRANALLICQTKPGV